MSIPDRIQREVDAARHSTVEEAAPDGQPPSLGVVAGFFYVIGLAMMVFGFVTMYYYDSYSGWGRIVGADAYNYVIIAVRGLGWILAGCAAIGIGAVCSIAATIRGAGRVVSMAALAILLAGCATLINGKSQNMPLRSTPSGADVTVGGLKATTPADLTLTRDKSYQATFTKEGYPERRVELKSEPSWWLVGNVLFGGIIGLIVDLATGAGYVILPESADVDLASGVVKNVPEVPGPTIQKTRGPSTPPWQRAPTDATNFGSR